MKKKLLNISGKVDFLVKPLANIKKITDQLGIPFFIVGATARDLILQYGYGINTGLTTYDLDIAISIKDWNSYEQLMTSLQSSGKFKKGDKKQRLLYGEDELPIDVIPFGTIADADGYVRWPPDQKTSLNILGFNEALQDAIEIILDESLPLKLKCASIVGMSILKLVAWTDRSEYNRKDAMDLALYLKYYAEVGNLERLYSEHSELLKDEEYDLEFAGARLLGMDMAQIISDDQKQFLLKVLKNECREDGQLNLIQAMVPHPFAKKNSVERYLLLLKKLMQGLEES